MSGSVKAHRLPTRVKPRHYDLRLRASPGEPRFHGEVRLEVEVATATSEVELHALGLEFRRVAAEQAGAVPGRAEVHADTESVVLRFDRPLQPGRAVLDLAWDAPVSPSLVGLYLSKDGPEECLVTQFEATDARKCFPCFDEPAFKGTLKWTVQARKGLTVLANGPLVRKHDEADGWTTWEFAPTPPLSSYLAAVAIGRFGGTPEVKAQGVPMRVYAMEGKEHLGLEARDAAAALLPWFADYFGVGYRFGKYDQVAVPSFSFGAMENAGLVVFRASRLLMDPKTAAWKDRRDITLVVSHEFAHQWFGNHVTMAWWDDLWLNESFAEWIAHRAVDALWPEHEVWIDFQGRTTRALNTDALGATHPIYQPVQTPAEAAELFDAITYGKGSSVLRMLEGFLGAEAFKKGLRTYMQEFGGSNAAGADLWRHLGHAADRPVERIMQNWVAQAGHPVVQVGHFGHELRLRQQRFRSAPGVPAGGQRWDVPLVVRYEDEAGTHELRHLLAAPEERVPLRAQGTLKWLHANAGDVGFYRTDPDDGLLRGLTANFAALTPAERVGMLRDQWSLARAGFHPPGRALGLLAAVVPSQTHYAVVEQAVDIVRDAERLLETATDAAALQAFRRWAGRTFAPVLHHVGPEGTRDETPAKVLLRAAAYRAVAGTAREPKAVEAAMRLAGRERGDPEAVDPNLAYTLVNLAAQHGDAARFDEHKRVYVQRRDSKRPPQEADRYLGSFPHFRAPELVGRTLALLQDGTVPKQSIGPLLTHLLKEPHAQAQAWEHTTRHWDHLRSQLGDSWAANLVEASGSLPPARRREVETFLDAKAKDLVQSGNRARDLLAERDALFAKVVPALAAWAKQA